MQVTEKQLRELIISEKDAKELLEEQYDFLDGDFQFSGVVSEAGDDLYGSLFAIIPSTHRALFSRLCEDLYLKGYKRALRSCTGEERLESLLEEIRGKKCQKKQKTTI